MSQGRTPTTLVYFDNSVLEPIAEKGVGGRVKSLLKGHGALAFGSIQNLIEFFRIDDDDQKRARRIRTLLQVARIRETEPILDDDIRSLVTQIGLRHPDWINLSPSLTIVEKDRDSTRRVWKQLKENPQYRPPGFLRNRTRLKAQVGESMRRHRSQGHGPTAASFLHDAVLDPGLDARMKPLIDALPAIESYWRVQLGLAYWSAVGEADPQLMNIRDWLGPHLLPARIDLESWMRFWVAELDATSLPRTRVEGLTDYFQTGVDSGNPGDIEHAGYSVGRDFLLTADRKFHEVLLNVRAVPNTTMATPVLIDRAARDVVAEIARPLGWG